MRRRGRRRRSPSSPAPKRARSWWPRRRPTALAPSRAHDNPGLVDVGFSEEQEALQTSVRAFLAERAPITPYVRRMLEDDRGTTDAVWQGLAALGATGLLVPEEHGGAGRGMVDMGVVLEELGRALHPGPFLSPAVSAV